MSYQSHNGVALARLLGRPEAMAWRLAKQDSR
jgi:hypothetical protein